MFGCAQRPASACAQLALTFINVLGRLTNNYIPTLSQETTLHLVQQAPKSQKSLKIDFFGIYGAWSANSSNLGVYYGSLDSSWEGLQPTHIGLAQPVLSTNHFIVSKMAWCKRVQNSYIRHVLLTFMHVYRTVLSATHSFTPRLSNKPSWAPILVV